MNKQTMENIIKQINKFQDDFLFHKDDFDEASFKMLVMTFMREVLLHLKDKETTLDYYG